jgi:hypothetical protein
MSNIFRRFLRVDL